MAAQAHSATNEVKRVSKFGLVGILNTIIDFGILNLLHLGLGVNTILANTVSTSVAMIFSFIANRNWVFTSKSRDVKKQALLFFLVTAFGLYVIQNGIIYLFTNHLPGFGQFAVSVSQALHLDAVLSDNFVKLNAVKALATLASLVWNYIWYKKVVFK